MYLWNRQSFSNLGLYRPNQSIERGYYAGVRLGDDSGTAVNLPVLIGGVALLGLGLFFLGGKTLPKVRHHRAARLRRRRDRISRQITELEA